MIEYISVLGGGGGVLQEMTTLAFWRDLGPTPYIVAGSLFVLMIFWLVKK